MLIVGPVRTTNPSAPDADEAVSGSGLPWSAPTVATFAGR